MHTVKVETTRLVANICTPINANKNENCIRSHCNGHVGPMRSKIVALSKHGSRGDTFTHRSFGSISSFESCTKVCMLGTAM